MEEPKIEPMMQDWEEAKRLLLGTSFNKRERDEVAPLLERIAIALAERSHLQQKKFDYYTWWQVDVTPPLEDDPDYRDRRHYAYLLTLTWPGELTAERIYRDMVRYFPPEFRITLSKHTGRHSFHYVAGNKPAQEYALHWGPHHANEAKEMKKNHSRIVDGSKLPKQRKLRA